MKNRAALLILLFLLVALPSGAWASEGAPTSETDANEAGDHAISDVVVTEPRTEISSQDIAANVSVITAGDIDRLPVSTAAEALQHLPGVYVEFNGGPGSFSSARIQGSEVRHVTVYRDGVPLNQSANPLTDLSYISVDAIERIEVYKGAASSAWNSSMGGVINIISKEPDPGRPFSADVRTSYGEARTWKTRGNASGAIDRFSYFLSLVHDESDGFIENTAYVQDSVYAKLNYKLDETDRLGFIFSHDKGRNEDWLPNYPDFWDDIYRRRTYERLLYETKPEEKIRLAFEGRHHRFYSKIDDIYVTHHDVWVDYIDESWGGSARVTWDINDSNTLSAGFEGDWGDFKNFNSRRYNTGDWSLHVNDSFTTGDFSISAGVRYDDNKEFDPEISPSVGIVYHFPGDEGLIRLQAARGCFAPDASMLYTPRDGNPDLEPEVAINCQFGGLYQLFEFLQFEWNFFHADIENFIIMVDGSPKYKNIDRATRQGVEGELRANFDFGLMLTFNGSYVDVRDKDSDDVIEDIPRTQFNASAHYTHAWSAHSLVGKYIDHNSSYPETKDRLFVFDYLLKVDLPVLKRHGECTLFAAVHNLFNSGYLYRYVWPQPGRWFEGGVRFEY